MLALVVLLAAFIALSYAQTTTVPIPEAPQPIITFDRTYASITAVAVVTVLLAYWAAFDFNGSPLTREVYLASRNYWKGSLLRVFYLGFEPLRWIEWLMVTIWLIATVVYVVQPMAQWLVNPDGTVDTTAPPVPIVASTTLYVPIVFALYLSRFFDGLAGALFFRVQAFITAALVGLLAGLGYVVLLVLIIWEVFTPQPGQQMIEEYIVLGVAIILLLWVGIKNIMRIIVAASARKAVNNDLEDNSVFGEKRQQPQQNNKK